MGWAPAALAAAPAVIQGISGLFGRKKKRKKLSTLSPEQKRLHKEWIDAIRGEGPLAEMYNFNPEKANAVFDANVARPAYRQYQETTIPSITGQFRGKNLGNSSYTGEALSRSGRDVQESLDAQRASALYQGEQDAYNRKSSAINAATSTQTQAYERPQERRNNIDTILEPFSKIGAQKLADQYTKFLNR